jgi:NhaP-type Na+/H+ and K+/H+ antiporter
MSVTHRCARCVECAAGGVSTDSNFSSLSGNPARRLLLSVAAFRFIERQSENRFHHVERYDNSARETAFASWVGLRGAVPIFLTIIPVLAGSRNAALLFGATFGFVIVSLMLQGWTISPAARILGFRKLPAEVSIGKA